MKPSAENQVSQSKFSSIFWMWFQHRSVLSKFKEKKLFFLHPKARHPHIPTANLYTRLAESNADQMSIADYWFSYGRVQAGKCHAKWGGKARKSHESEKQAFRVTIGEKSRTVDCVMIKRARSAFCKCLSEGVVCVCWRRWLLVLCMRRAYELMEKSLMLCSLYQLLSFDDLMTFQLSALSH